MQAELRYLHAATRQDDGRETGRAQEAAS